jgi:hypothetical protein
VFSGVTSLSGGMMLEGGALKVFQGALRVPEDAPSSFKGTANKLLWEAKVRLDIPSWPDWVKKIPLVVWPTEDQLGATGEVETLSKPEEEISQHTPAAIREPGFPEPEPHVTGPPPWLLEGEAGQGLDPVADVEPARVPEIEPDEVPVDEEEFDLLAEPEQAIPQAVGSAPDLPVLAKAINDAGIFGKERDLLIKDLLGKAFGFSLEVRRVDRSIGIYTEADYRDGQTVTGVVMGSDLEVVVYFPSDRNEEVKEWEPGSVHSVTAEVNDWDRLRKRPELLARG